MCHNEFSYFLFEPLDLSLVDVSAASLTFKTISFQTLARLLRATPEIVRNFNKRFSSVIHFSCLYQAERTAAQMVRQGRLSNVVIDGNKGFVRFAQRGNIQIEVKLL